MEERVQKVIDYVLNNNPNVIFRKCTKCGRSLPCDDLFYNKHPKGKYGYDSQCKECKNRIYKFNIPYNGDSLGVIYKNYRKMSNKQISKFYNIKYDAIATLLSKNYYETSRREIVKNLNKSEVIFMYESLLNGEIINLTNGFCKAEKSFEYLEYILSYLFLEKLEYNKEDIVSNLNSSLLKEYKICGAMITLKVNIKGILKIINKIYNEDIKIWQLKSSSVGGDFWSNEDNLKEVFLWTRLSLEENFDIYNIYEAEKYGFINILEELSLITVRDLYDSCISLFEDIYETKFDSTKKIIKKRFEENIIVELDYNNSLYEITDYYSELNNEGKTLISEIIRFCDNEKRFPSEKDLSNKNGYIARTQFSKYFNSFPGVYKYIKKREEEKPKFVECIKCKETKEFNKSNFVTSTIMKFGLSHQCKECATMDRQIASYKKKGIVFNNIFDIPVEQWWEYNYNSIINIMPKFCYNTTDNLIKIIRYILIDKLNYRSKEDILNNFKRDILNEYKINSIVFKMGGKLKALQLCFPEYNFTEEDIYTYDYDTINEIIYNFLNDNNFKVVNVLNCNIKPSRKLNNLIAWTRDNLNISSYQELMVWYFAENNIKHPVLNVEINLSHFKNKLKNYYSIKENRINETKNYCENISEVSILSVISETEKLKSWIGKYFKQQDICSNSLSYVSYYKTIYEMLIDAYPQIKENNVLFEWEWTQTNKNDKKFLIKMLREFVLYRMNNVVKNIEIDLPRYLNMSYIDIVFPKINHHIDKKRFKNYYEWACLSFPEFEHKWTISDFENIVSSDGNIFDSFQERDIYEHIQNMYAFKYIKNIGRLRGNHQYSFEDKNKEYNNRYCPDFVIDSISNENTKVKLNKPIILEYYGLFNSTRDDHIFKRYREKTIRKERFYKNNKDIYYIGIFPEDIKNNFEGLDKKLDMFCLNILPFAV